jgi:hypothetical protein
MIITGAGAWNIGTLQPIDAAALVGSRIIIRSGITAPSYCGIVAVSNEEGLREFGVFVWKAATLAWRANSVQWVVHSEDSVCLTEGSGSGSRACAWHSNVRNFLLCWVAAGLCLTVEGLTTAALLGAGVDAHSDLEPCGSLAALGGCSEGCAFQIGEGLISRSDSGNGFILGAVLLSVS